MSHTYTYIFIFDQLDKYKRLIAEAKTIEMRRFCQVQLAMYQDKYNKFKSCGGFYL